jgi:hypothetical protein
MSIEDTLNFVETAPLSEAPPGVESATEAEPPPLDQLPSGLVSGNTLIDFSKVATGQLRSAVSLALLFAARAADAQFGPKPDEDRWFAAYKSNLRRLGFLVPETAVAKSRFEKQGIFVHKAIIPFLTIAFGGAGLGPVILAALQNLQEVDKDKPWITLFDRESRRFTTREMSFAAVEHSGSQSVVRHVSARLNFDQSETNILFFRISETTAEFESATTTMSADDALLTRIEPRLRQRLEADIFSFIAEAKV